MKTMKRMDKKAVWTVLCCMVVTLLVACAKDVVDTTGSIYGIVNDMDNGEPLSGAHVVLNPGGKTTNTGSDGRYEFLDMEPGQYTIQISKSGYKTNTKRISVVAGEEASGDMQLERGEASIRLNTNVLVFDKGESSKTFEVMNVGTSGSVSWTLTCQADWLNVTPQSGTTAQGKNSAVIVSVDRSKITEDVTTNLLVEAEGESLPLEVQVVYGEESQGGGDEPGDTKGSCKKIVSCDSEVAVEFLSCVKSGNVVEFQFTVTNNRDDWQVWFDRDGSDAYDDKGNSYPGYYTKIYIGDTENIVTNGNAVNFLKGVKTKFRVVIPDVKDEASELQRWDWVISSSQPWSPQVKKVVLEGVKW